MEDTISWMSLSLSMREMWLVEPGSENRLAMVVQTTKAICKVVENEKVATTRLKGENNYK